MYHLWFKEHYLWYLLFFLLLPHPNIFFFVGLTWAERNASALQHHAEDGGERRREGRKGGMEVISICPPLLLPPRTLT